MSAEPVSAVDAGGHGGWVMPQFRVVTTKGRRRGVRLEKVFWRLLDEIAARRGQKRSHLVGEIIEQSPEGSEGVASLLRCFVAKSLDLERSALVTRWDAAQTIVLMQQAPVPAFAINRQKKLQQVNAEFMQLLRPTVETSSSRSVAEFVHLALDTPIDELFSAAAAAASTQCGYTLQVDDRRRRGRAKIVLVPNDKPDTLVGYVLP